MNDRLRRQGDFIRRSKERYGEDKFDLSRVVYVNVKTKVTIGCKKHGWFEITPLHHLEGFGGCKDCMNENRKSIILGIGINDLINGTLHPLYRHWRGAIERSVSVRKKRECPTYSNVKICDEWRYLSNFVKWGEDPANGYHDGYALDKDILVGRNNIYSPDTCCFVPQEINNLIKSFSTQKGLPAGVTFRRGKYAVYLGMKITTGKKHAKFIGNFGVLSDAIFAYKTAKESYIREVAAKYYNEGKITEKVCNALMNYEVEITD